MGPGCNSNISVPRPFFLPGLCEGSCSETKWLLVVYRGGHTHRPYSHNCDYKVCCMGWIQFIWLRFPEFFLQQRIWRKLLQGLKFCMMSCQWTRSIWIMRLQMLVSSAASEWPYPPPGVRRLHLSCSQRVSNVLPSVQVCSRGTAMPLCLSVCVSVGESKNAPSRLAKVFANFILNAKQWTYHTGMFLYLIQGSQGGSLNFVHLISATSDYRFLGSAHFVIAHGS